MKVKIGDVVDKIVGDEDRLTTSLKYYIGGEHIETSRIKVRNRGLLDSEKGRTLGYQFHYPFEPGDVLFMTKNPYLKKCGQVDFSGICSIATFVLRTKNERVLLQDYLAVITQTDDFWNYLEANKSGSVNYFITWKTLEAYEFELPEVARQQELAEIIFASEELLNRYEKQIIATDALVKSHFIEMFGNPITNSMGWPTEQIKKVAPEFKPKIPEMKEYWWLNLDMIESYSGRVIDKVIASVDNIGNSTSTFDNTMVMYSKLRPYLNKVVVPNDFGYATTELVGLKPDVTVLNKYFLFNLLRGDDFVAFADGISGGAQMPRMPLKALREFQCILPPLKLQEEFVEFSKQCDKSKHEIEQAILNLVKMTKAILNENVG